MKYLKEIKIVKAHLASVVLVMLCCLVSSVITFKIIETRIPKVAVVDLSYLNNEFILNVAKHLVDKEVPNSEIDKTVKSYLQHLETLLVDISKSGNYLLLQKQTVISKNIADVTKDIEQVLFESVTSNITKEESND